ncbi:universal stress protein [Pseudactinotalea sp. HY160]|uniref:universal stress protein n=1 Tax=Pseudactinotalea sp. HY160 TaxID=2654490 RepID=UPI00128BCDAB|nr:universal stress protein [Pseudactinotalea sp. HY160]MPV49112.1 universal stress protein [Pseudactinotalea sp. HY160]
MRFVVGYAPDRRGADAVRLASTLASNRGAALDIVAVLPVEHYDSLSPDRSYQLELERQGHEWLEQALQYVPAGIKATGHLRRAESIAEGLIAAATDPELGETAAAISIGATHRGIQGRFTLGSVASGLLHAAPVPVALPPAGYPGHPTVTRVTCATGNREGAQALLEVAIDSAAGRRVPLRIMSLVALGAGQSDDRGDRALLEEAELHAGALAERAAADLSEASPVTSVIGRGKSLEEAAQSLEFEPSEIVIVGSSRLAGPRQLFIGASARKMLRALPVPMIVVPREYDFTARP